MQDTIERLNVELNKFKDDYASLIDEHAKLLGKAKEMEDLIYKWVPERDSKGRFT